jgi:hypothetical protein
MLVPVFLAFEFKRASLRHAAHALADLDAGDGAFAEVVIEAIGIAILDP